MEKRINLHRHKFISEKFLKIKTEFHDEAQKKDEEMISNGMPLDVLELAKIIENALIKITKSFYNERGFIRIFIVGPSDDKRLKLLAASDRVTQNNLDHFSYDLSCIPKEIIQLKRTVSNQDELDGFEDNYLRCLEKGIFYDDDPYRVEKNDIVRYYPTLTPKVSFVIWKRYEYAEKFLEKHNNGQFFIFKNAMLDFYTSIAANYATLWGSLIEKKLEDAVRIAGHESNQIIPRLKDTILLNFDNTFNLRELLQQELVYKKVEDLINHIELLKFIQEKPAYIFKSQDLKISEIDVHEIFYKLLNMYKIQVNHKDIWIDISKEKDKKEHTIIEGDKILFEHAINNLVDNAIKYCHRGTKIRLQIVEKGKTFVLHVISYGPKIVNKRQIFELYQREQTNVEGLGIGMYIVKKVVNAHKWQIEVESNSISEFNIPCLANYFKEKEKNNERNLLIECSQSQIKLIHSIPYFNEEDYIDIIAKREKKVDYENSTFRSSEKRLIFQPGPITFSKEFEKPTFKNDFIIVINKKNKT